MYLLLIFLRINDVPSPDISGCGTNNKANGSTQDALWLGCHYEVRGEFFQKITRKWIGTQKQLFSCLWLSGVRELINDITFYESISHACICRPAHRLLKSAKRWYWFMWLYVTRSYVTRHRSNEKGQTRDTRVHVRLLFPKPDKKCTSRRAGWNSRLLANWIRKKTFWNVRLT